MTWVAVAIGGSAAVGYFGSQNAARTQSNSAQQGIDAQERMYNKDIELSEPFRKAGIQSTNELLRLLGLDGDTTSSDYGKYARGFSTSDFQEDPGYRFRLKEGLDSIQKSAAARGGLLSGNTLKAINNYGQEAASQEYTNAFNRYQANKASRINPLLSLSGEGQTAATVLGNQGQNYASNVGDLYQSQGNANASGYVGGVNSLTSGLNNYLRYSQDRDILNRLYQ